MIAPAYGIDGARFDRNGVPYTPITNAGTESGDDAMRIAERYAASHPNAAAQIHRMGDPYAWVFASYDHGTGLTTYRCEYDSGDVTTRTERTAR